MSLINKEKLFKFVRRVCSKTFALAEKNIKMSLRYKFYAIMQFITPLITIFMSYVIFSKMFEITSDFGQWTSQNYFIFIFIGYSVLLLRNMITGIPQRLHEEKVWKTIPALMVAPFNRFYLLLGYFISEFFMIFFPFLVFTIVLFILNPISIITLAVIVIAYFCLAIIFTGISMFVGVFAISNENIWALLRFLTNLIFWASCISYPFEIFPEPLQKMIVYNPIYQIINFLRLLWLENNVLLTITNHIPEVIIFAISLITFPLVAIYLFNYVYKKLGITGY